MSRGNSVIHGEIDGVIDGGIELYLKALRIGRSS